MEHRFLTVETAEIPWQDAEEMVGMAHVEIKPLKQPVDEDDSFELIVRLPPGFHEPYHVHEGSHAAFILEGRQVHENGKFELGPGDFVYGPSNEPHGPFDYPDGCTLFVSFRGDLVHVPLDGDVVELRK
jgi:anti-sigma factor ChrR (cupin superfamily)